MKLKAVGALLYEYSEVSGRGYYYVGIQAAVVNSRGLMPINRKGYRSCYNYDGCFTRPGSWGLKSETTFWEAADLSKLVGTFLYHRICWPSSMYAASTTNQGNWFQVVHDGGASSTGSACLSRLRSQSLTVLSRDPDAIR